MQIRETLAMSMAHHVNGHALKPKGQVGAVISVDATNEELVGLATTRMLAREQTRRDLNDIGRIRHYA